MRLLKLSNFLRVFGLRYFIWKNNDFFFLLIFSWKSQVPVSFTRQFFGEQNMKIFSLFLIFNFKAHPVLEPGATRLRMLQSKRNSRKGKIITFNVYRGRLVEDERVLTDVPPERDWFLRGSGLEHREYRWLCNICLLHRFRSSGLNILCA